MPAPLFLNLQIMKQTLAIILAASGLVPCFAAQEARLMRFPATNGSEIVFSYAGDLYTVPVNGGEARRITSHEGYEIFPRFSPDGQNIAFSGQYDGNSEIYLVGRNGGEPKRLTYTSTNGRDDMADRMGPNNITITWTPDGKQILYRNRIGDGFPGKLWQVAPEGGMPYELPLPEGGFASYSPDGKKMAYNRTMREFRTWKYYRGGMADDIWIYDPDKKDVENITNNVAQDIIPMWIGDEIFFISDRDKTMNLFAYNTKTKSTRKVTDYTEYDIKFPSSNGNIIVYENGGYLYKFDPKKGTPEKVTVTLTTDAVQARPELKDVSGNITAVSLSPGGNRIAITARGEVFDVPVGNGVTRDITRTPGSNDRDGEWSPDGKYIAYIGDNTGETEVYLYGVESGKTEQLTKGNDTYVRSIQWTPDSKDVVYTDRKNRIVMVNVASKSKKTLLTNPEGEIRDLTVSPDSKWISYSRSGDNNMGVVYMMNIASGKEYPITENWYDSNSPMFSQDGKYLYFVSARDFNPTYGSLEWNHVYNGLDGIYMALLSNDTPSPFINKDASDKKDYNAPKEAKTDKAGAKGKKAAAESDSKDLKFDPEGIGHRILKVPVAPGYQNLIYADNGKLWHGSRGGVAVFDLASQKDEEIGRGRMSVSADGKKAAVLNRGELSVVNFPCSSFKGGEEVDLADLIAPVDYSKEWPQIFDEVWRAFRDGFYLENMHGVDWNAIKAKYAALLPYAKTRRDLNYIIGEMIGELACGHAYVNPGDVKSAKRIPMGLLGAELSRDKSGYYRIDKIIPGAPYSETLRSPLEEPGLGVKEGDFIVAIDGIPVTETDNIYSLLIGKADRPTELAVNSKASADGAKKVVVKPIDNEYPLYHYNWVQDNIRKVSEATDGRVGYIYIPDMGPEGLNEFARYFYPQLDKEALIIDDRENGGGNISPMIIERLLRKPYRMTMSRTSSKTSTIPDATHVGPKVLLINKYSASDGDLFPWSFKANNLGTVIGTRTWGGIIGISGSLPYMDGTDVRVPFFTNYDAKTGQWIVENHGVDPDILIDNNPILENEGIDEQLNKAIEVALEQLKDRKPMPKVPAPRTFKDLGL